MDFDIDDTEEVILENLIDFFEENGESVSGSTLEDLASILYDFINDIRS